MELIFAIMSVVLYHKCQIEWFTKYLTIFSSLHDKRAIKIDISVQIWDLIQLEYSEDLFIEPQSMF